MNNLRTAGGLAYQPAVAYAEPPVSPPVTRMTPVSVPAPVHVAAPAAPVAQPAVEAAAPVAPPQPAAPAPAPQAAPAAAAQESIPAAGQDLSTAVFVHLSSGERIWAGRFDTRELADRRAFEIVRALNRPEPGVWAKFGNRMVRPDAVVSVELAERRED